ncbi:MAG: hypothetical protein ACLFP6_02740 [Spirochaetaceae bacterium]
MKVQVEMELDVDLKELSLSELQRIVRQLFAADESRVVRKAKVTDIRIKK